MKGSQKVLDVLNLLLIDELAARDQYFIHSSMQSEWGLGKIAARVAHEMTDETEHARILISRILFLEGIPNMVPAQIHIGKDLPDMLRKDLDVEYQVIKNLRDAMKLCEEEKDFVTRDILLTLLTDTEEDHAHWLEKQLRLIDMTGLPNYLQSQMQADSSN